MIIQHAILHILDTNTGSLIASQGEMATDSPATQEYIDKLVSKIQRGDVKTGTLSSTDELVEMANSSDFVQMTTQLAERLFDIISVSEVIQPGDLLSFLATTDEGKMLGLIKLNFSPRYSHAINYDNEQMVNDLVLNQAILPSSSQALDEAILVNLESLRYQLIEKQHIIDGHRIAYFSEKFLKISPETSMKESLQTIKRAVATVAEKYDDTLEHEALAATQSVIYESLSDGKIDTDVIAEKVFPENVSAQNQYKEAVAEKLPNKTIAVENIEKYEKKYRVQKFKLDSGIEIKIPMSVYQDSSKVVFENNEDGTVSLVIKDIESVLNKFTG